MSRIKKMKVLGKIRLPFVKTVGGQECEGETVITVLTDGHKFWLHIIPDRYSLTPEVGELYRTRYVKLCQLSDVALKEAEIK